MEMVVDDAFFFYRGSGKGTQTLIHMTNDMNMDKVNEDVGIEDIPSPMSVNQTVHSVNQSVRKRKGRPHVDIVAGFSEVAEKMCLNFQQEVESA